MSKFSCKRQLIERYVRICRFNCTNQTVIANTTIIWTTQYELFDDKMTRKNYYFELKTKNFTTKKDFEICVPLSIIDILYSNYV